MIGATIHPVILSGGSGTRLWPVSRAMYPKQLMPLASTRSMLQETIDRVTGEMFGAPMIVCNSEHRFIVAGQLLESHVTAASILLEPMGRNTAPAAAVAALQIVAADPKGLMLLMPSDHVVGDVASFHKAVAKAARAAMTGKLTTFGITPDRPETGYGYIKRGASLGGLEGVHVVDAFVEKPDHATAEGYLAEGTYLWNSGIFLFGAARFLEELNRLQPQIVAAGRAALDQGQQDLDFFRLDAEAFAASPSASIDYAVMEHTDCAAVVPVDMGWNDVGAWPALWDIGTKDADGNVFSGDVVAQGVRNSYIRSEGRLVAATGIEDAVIVVTDDVVLVTTRDDAQTVKDIVERLKAAGRSEPVFHSTVYRPWGSFQSVDQGERFQVKRITVNPGAKLSLQLHHHRAEHWVVVAGTAKVTRGEETLLLHENQSTYIPLGVVHRLENPGKVPLHLIEVQSGAYLGEDDIVRLDDTYGRG